uniref:glutathione S-transferase family protein n=1 Tax=Parerythrobacter lutipelagi TaxID=1964208 RepID=UPI0010F71C01|nr:glutathione S-transferase family protein [Parerythrobacter lutipelagi]
MWRLYQFPLCPFSRKVRLLLSEKGVGYELWRENPWDNRDEFWALNPAGRTPVLHDPDKKTTLCDSRAICEYFEETTEQSPLINGTSKERAEIRRLIALFDESFFNDVTGPMMHEKMKKRIILRQPPDSRRLSGAMKMAHGHLDYIDWLIDNRTWIAGPRMSLADLAAAAQISVADYLGGIDWDQHKSAKSWYSVIKSRPSFRPLLSERMEVIQPPSHYASVDG